MNKIIVIGAGLGGLTAAVELARQGANVTLLEANPRPGGCASTFEHRGYKFDTGATVATGFAPDGVLNWIGQQLDIKWEPQLYDPAMAIHLPDRTTVRRWGDPDKWQAERLRHFGEESEAFWKWQEQTAQKMWEFARRLPPWPPRSIKDISTLMKLNTEFKLLSHLGDASKAIGKRMRDCSEKLRLYVDAQLLISAQTTSRKANALYSTVALDLARQGTGYFSGGIGTLAQLLAEKFKTLGGEIIYNREVTGVIPKEGGGTFTLLVKDHENIEGDILVFNSPWCKVKRLLNPHLSKDHFPSKLKGAWGAVVIHMGIDKRVVPDELPLNHQVIIREPLSRNSIFLSVSPAWDETRAPKGKRAITISMHTRLKPWRRAYDLSKESYDIRKAEHVNWMLEMAEWVLPDIRAGMDILLTGTPVTFQHYLLRPWGFVGGFPKTNLFQDFNPYFSKNMWVCGDTVFPGQSIPSVMLNGLRTAREILA